MERFIANTYITLTRTMDHHDVTCRGKTYVEVLQSIVQPTLMIGIDSDILYLVVEQKELAVLIPSSKLAFLESHHGHDAFLMDMDVLNQFLLNLKTQIP